MRGFTTPAPLPAAAEPTSLAVLPFENTARDTELDWLGDGLSEMLTYDLSQSPDLDILSRSRLNIAEVPRSSTRQTSA